MTVTTDDAQDSAEPDVAEDVTEESARPAPSTLTQLGAWARASLVPPEIWGEDRPSLKRQYAYARRGQWGPQAGPVRTAGVVAFWVVSFPTSVAAYYVEWVGERPSRWLAAAVLLSLSLQIPYVTEVLSVLIRIPAWPITATWAVLS
jgi:hypothetical protein